MEIMEKESMRDKRDWQSLRTYMEEIKEYPPLSVQEEFELAQRIQEGDQGALETLIKSNLRFVVAIANRYQGCGLPLPDLISEGNLGLIKAAQRFNASRGFKFITYAVWWIRQSILLALANHGRVVRLPLHRLNDIKKIGCARDELQQRFEREPSIEEIARNAEMTTFKALDVLMTSAPHISLDMNGAAEENTTMSAQLVGDQHASPEILLLEKSLHQEVHVMISSLPSREAEIIRMYFGLNGELPQTLEQLALHYNVTLERMRQIKERALMRLRRQSLREHRGGLAASAAAHS